MISTDMNSNIELFIYLFNPVNITDSIFDDCAIISPLMASIVGIISKGLDVGFEDRYVGLGKFVDCGIGMLVGMRVGMNVGKCVNVIVGIHEGMRVERVGEYVGMRVGLQLGRAVGSTVGSWVGGLTGVLEGADGAMVGDSVGMRDTSLYTLT